MSMPYRLVVFDWEGTLGDPLGHVHQAIELEAKQLGLGEYNADDARQFVSLGLDKAVRKIFPNLSLHQYERLLLGVQQKLVSNHAAVYLFPGAREVIEQLHNAGVFLAIATNRGAQALERALQAAKLDTFFRVTRAAGQVAAKPHPQMLEEILDVFGCEAADALMIGDSAADMEMAFALHVPSVGVDFYNQQRSALEEAGASQVFHNFVQLAAYLELPYSTEGEGL